MRKRRTAVAARILAAVILGGIIGLERELKETEQGLAALQSEKKELIRNA